MQAPVWQRPADPSVLRNDPKMGQRCGSDTYEVERPDRRLGHGPQEQDCPECISLSLVVSFLEQVVGAS